jgi:hypothetical protein
LQYISHIIIFAQQPPSNDNGILKIDTINGGTVTLLDTELPESGTGGWRWVWGALALDGCIYFMPGRARRILKFNPEDERAVSVGEDLVGGWGCKYAGTIIGNDGYLYGIPYCSNRIVRFNPIDQSISLVGEEADVRFECDDGALGRDGYIYASSYDGRIGRLLKIDVANNIYSFVEHGIWAHSVGWGAPLLGNDGCIYWPPAAANRTLKFDPETHVASLVGDHFEDTSLKRMGEVVGPGGAIFYMPSTAIEILVENSKSKILELYLPSLFVYFAKSDLIQIVIPFRLRLHCTR